MNSDQLTAEQAFVIIGIVIETLEINPSVARLKQARKALERIRGVHPSLVARAETLMKEVDDLICRRGD